MSIKAILSIVFCSITLGCAHTTPKVSIVEKLEPVIIKTPADLLEPVPLPEPPAKDNYLLSNCSKKETMLADYSVSLLVGLDKCNTRINAIKSFQDKASSIERVKDE